MSLLHVKSSLMIFIEINIKLKNKNRSLVHPSYGVDKMTICIAAISKEKNKEFIVFATDHMVSTMTGAFEHSIKKYRELNNCTVAMLSGQVLLFEDLIKLDGNESNFNEIKNKIYENFKRKRNEIIKSEIFNIYGIDEQYFKDVLSKPVPNPIIQKVLTQVSEFNLKTNILLIGFDGNEARIADISDFHMIDFTSLNFHSIGSGTIQSDNTLLFQKHGKHESLINTIYNVYKAKRNAEVMNGVGKETELLILRKDIGCRYVNPDQLKILSEVYEEEFNYYKDHKKLKGLVKVAGGFGTCS